jgi:hypothetical protein
MRWLPVGQDLDARFREYVCQLSEVEFKLAVLFQPAVLVRTVIKISRLPISL